MRVKLAIAIAGIGLYLAGANVPLEKLCHEWADKEKPQSRLHHLP